MKNSNRLKRSIALLVTVLMMASAFAGCGSNEDTKTDATEQATAVETASETATETATETASETKLPSSSEPDGIEWS